MLTKRRSNFFYLAVGEDVYTFTLSRKYVWSELFNDRNEDYLKQMVAFCKLKYTRTTFKKVSTDRKEHMAKVLKNKGQVDKNMGSRMNGSTKGNDIDEGSPAKGAKSNIAKNSVEITHSR